MPLPVSLVYIDTVSDPTHSDNLVWPTDDLARIPLLQSPESDFELGVDIKRLPIGLEARLAQDGRRLAERYEMRVRWNVCYDSVQLLLRVASTVRMSHLDLWR
jgi:hypothetical protein